MVRDHETGKLSFDFIAESVAREVVAARGVVVPGPGSGSKKGGARSRYPDAATRTTTLLFVATRLASLHPVMMSTVDCAEITQVSLDGLRGRLKYLLGGKGSLCVRLHKR